MTFCRVPPDGSNPGKVLIYRSEAKWGKSVKIITGAVIAILVAVMVTVTINAFEAGNLMMAVAIDIFIPGLLLMMYAFAPRAYEITQTGIVVRRLLRSFEIPFSKIERMYRRDLSLVRLRLFAVGGLFGYFGLYYAKDLGKVWAYVTRNKDVLVIETANNRYAISPDQNFYEILQKIKSEAKPFELDKSTGFHVLNLQKAPS